MKLTKNDKNILIVALEDLKVNLECGFFDLIILNKKTKRQLKAWKDRTNKLLKMLNKGGETD